MPEPTAASEFLLTFYLLFHPTKGIRRLPKILSNSFASFKNCFLLGQIYKFFPTDS